MQKRFLSLMAAAFIAVILFSSCSKDNKQGRYVPATAAMVLHLNGESLNEKLPWEEVKQNGMFAQISADTSIPAFAKSILENPENSGINMKGDMVIFMVKDSAGGYAGIEGFIKDEAKFKTMLTNANKNAKESIKDGYTYFADEKASIGYNKERFIVTINVPQLNMMNKMAAGKLPTDSSFGGSEEVKYDRDMNVITASMFALKANESLAENEKFTDLVKTKGDVHFWYNAQYFDVAGSMGPMGAMVNTKKLTDGAIFAGTVNFDNGKINLDGKSYANKEVMDIYKKYATDGFDKSMIKNIPSQNLAGMMIMNFKAEGIREIMKLLGVDGLLNMATANMGFTMDDIVKAGKGDMMFAVTDISTDTAATEKARFIFSAAVGDKASMNKLIDAGKKAAPMMGMNDSSRGNTSLSYNMNDKYFVWSNNKTATDAYLAGAANTSYSFVDKISGGSFGGFVNFQYIMNAMKPAPTADSLSLAAFDASVKMFDNMLLSGGNVKGGAITQHWEINLVDKNTNSLKQLNKFAGTMALIQDKKKKKNEATWAAEDLQNFPAPIAPIDSMSEEK
ncbi:MAG: DUF4836 family protein [Ferruginibacter sp.]